MKILDQKRIFVIEDNSLNRLVFRMTLSTQGALVEFANGKLDALEKLQQFGRVDAIVLDLMLARGTSGFDIVPTLREIDSYSAVPIVAVSATDPVDGIPLAREHGLRGFIAKPIDNVLFPEQLSHIIAGQEVWYSGRYMGVGEA